MVRVRYLGITNPVATFERFRPWRNELVGLQRECFPFRSDYVALDSVVRALDTAAIYFTRNPHFYVPQYFHPRFHADEKEYPKP